MCPPSFNPPCSEGENLGAFPRQPLPWPSECRWRSVSPFASSTNAGFTKARLHRPSSAQSSSLLTGRWKNLRVQRGGRLAVKPVEKPSGSAVGMWQQCEISPQPPPLRHSPVPSPLLWFLPVPGYLRGSGYSREGGLGGRRFRAKIRTVS